MPLEYLYAFAIILLAILIGTSFATRFFLREASKSWFSSFNSALLILPIISITALLVGGFTTYYSINQSQTESFKKLVPDYNTVISRFSPAGQGSDLTKSYSSIDFELWKKAVNLSDNSEINIVTGSVTLQDINTQSGRNISKVRLIGLDNISEDDDYFNKINLIDWTGSANITNPWNTAGSNSYKLNLKDVPQDLTLKGYIGRDMNDSAVILVSANKARTILNIPSGQYNSTLVNLKSSYDASKDLSFSSINLEQKFRQNHSDNLPVIAFVLVLFFPLIFSIILFVLGLKRFVTRNKDEFLKYKNLGIISDMLALYGIQKLLVIILAGMLLGLAVGFGLAKVLIDVIAKYYSVNNSLLIDPSLVNIGLHLNNESVWIEMSVVFSVIILIIYFTFSYLFSRSSASIAKANFTYAPNKYVKLLRNMSNIFFTVIALILIYNALFGDNKIFSVNDQKAFKGALLFLAIEILFLSLKKFILWKFASKNFDRIYFAFAIVVSIVLIFIPPFSDTFKYWEIFYVVLIIFTLIFLSLIIRNFRNLLLLLCIAVTGLNFAGVQLVDNYFENNNQALLGTDIAFKSHTSEDFQNRADKNLFSSFAESGIGLVDMINYKQIDYKDRYPDQTDTSKKLFTQILSSNPEYLKALNVSFKTARDDLKSTSDVIDALNKEDNTVVVGNLFTVEEAKAYVPALKIGDEIKVQSSDNQSAPVQTKKIIAVLDSPSDLGDSIIEALKPAALKSLSYVYSLNLKDKSQIPEVRKQILSMNIDEYADINQTVTTAKVQYKSLMQAAFINSLFILVVILIEYIINRGLKK